jgi:beta-lactamase class A
VADNTLSVRAGNDLAGDPIFGEPKTLEVECVVDGQQKSLSVPEGGFLEIPKLDPIGTVDELLALVKRCPAEVGFFGVDLAAGKTIEYRPDQPACMASIVKLFTLLEVMSQIRAGRFNPTDKIRVENRAMSIDDALNYMIGLSDNAATNALTARVGYDRVNALPAELGMAGVSDRILPEPGVLDDVLDRRVTGPKVLPADDKLLPQHATARGMVKYFELLHKGELKSPELSADVLAVLDRWPRGFVPGAPADLPVVGKGGSIAWRRIGHPPYDMAGWDIYLRNGDTAVALCMWTEWFPDRMPQELKDKWCYAISDGIASVLLSAAPAAN